MKTTDTYYTEVFITVRTREKTGRPTDRIVGESPAVTLYQPRSKRTLAERRELAEDVREAIRKLMSTDAKET